MKRLKEIVANILELRPEEINDDTSPDNTQTWDSLNGLMMVTELEKNFNVKFTMDEIISVKRFADIKTSLKNRGIEFKE